MKKQLKIIFKRKRNVTIMVTVFFLVSLFMLLLPQLHVVRGLFQLFGFLSVNFWSGVWGLIMTSFSIMTFLQKLVFLLFNILFAVNVFLFMRYVRNYRRVLRGANTHLSFWGMVLGIFGTGCLSCGVILLTPLASIFGLGAATWFAHNGLLVSLFGLVLVFYSCYVLLKGMTNPEVCEAFE